MLEDLRRRAGRFGLDVLMVNVWEHVEAAEEAVRFAAIHGLQGPLYLDDKGYMKSLCLSGVPMNLLVDVDGTVKGVGMTTPAELEEALPLLGIRWSQLPLA